MSNAVRSGSNRTENWLLDLAKMTVMVYFNKRYFSGDENLTSRDSEENGWKRSRDILGYRLFLKI